MIRAVTFDFWNTVMWETPGDLKAHRLGLWAEVLDTAEIAVDPATLERVHDAAHFAYEAAWKAGDQFRVEHAIDHIVETLGIDLPPDVRTAVLEGFSEAGRRATIQPAEGVERCLRDLGEAGVRLGIVCDIGLTPSPVVRERLRDVGLLECFDDTTFSDEVGHYKPSPAIFKHALAALGDVEPQAAAHVGDRRRTDVGGAKAMGMLAVRYNGVYEDETAAEPEADLVTGDLGELPRLLGVGRRAEAGWR